MFIMIGSEHLFLLPGPLQGCSDACPDIQGLPFSAFKASWAFLQMPLQFLPHFTPNTHYAAIFQFLQEATLARRACLLHQLLPMLETPLFSRISSA